MVVIHEGCLAVGRQTRACHKTGALIQARCHACRQQKHPLKPCEEPAALVSLHCYVHAMKRKELALKNYRRSEQHRDWRLCHGTPGCSSAPGKPGRAGSGQGPAG